MGKEELLQMQQGSAARGIIPTMLELPRSVVLQQGLPATALESNGGWTQAVLHQMGIAGKQNERVSISLRNKLCPKQSLEC